MEKHHLAFENSKLQDKQKKVYSSKICIEMMHCNIKNFLYEIFFFKKKKRVNYLKKLLYKSYTNHAKNIK
jgi:hypothetical protein